MNGGEFEGIDEFGEPGDVFEVCDPNQAHPQWFEVCEGVNYVASWRTARLAAARLHTVLCRAELPTGRLARVRVRVRGDGSAVVCLELELPTAAALAQLIDEALRERQEGAPKIRGAPSRHVA